MAVWLNIIGINKNIKNHFGPGPVLSDIIQQRDNST